MTGPPPPGPPPRPGGPPPGEPPPGGPPPAGGPPSSWPDPAAPTEVLSLPRRSRPSGRDLLAALRREVPVLVVLAVAAVAFWRIGLQHWREGTTELGLALLIGALLRGCLDDAAAGLLAVRGRAVDVLTYAGAGAVVVFVSLTITGGVLAGP